MNHSSMPEIGPFKGSVSRHGDKQKLVVIPTEFHSKAANYHDKKYKITILLDPISEL